MSQSELVGASDELKAEAKLKEVDALISLSDAFLAQLKEYRKRLQESLPPPNAGATVDVAIRQMKWMKSQPFADGKQPHWTEYAYLTDIQGRENPGAKTLETAIRNTPTGLLVFSDFEYSLFKNGKGVNRRRA